MGTWIAAWLPRRTCLLLEVATSLLGLSATGWARDLPPSQQYVNISGLPGGGQPLDPLGRATWEGPGAVQLNIPLAFTPSRGYWSVGAWAGGCVPPFRGASEPEIPLASGHFRNGTALIGAGMGRPGRGIYVGDMFKSRRLDQAYNLQWQAVHSTAGAAGIAIGMQDVTDAERGARSLYVVASKIFARKPRSPALTLGCGGGRFRHRIFAGFSLQLNKRAYGTVEYDGLQYNGGFVLQVWRAKSVLASLTLAVNDRDRPLIGVSLAGRQR